jgi:hypothetical protein
VGYTHGLLGFKRRTLIQAVGHRNLRLGPNRNKAKRKSGNNYYRRRVFASSGVDLRLFSTISIAF